MWGMERGIGWLSGAVERRRGAQGGGFFDQEMRNSYCMHFCIARQFGGMDPFLLLPSTKDKWGRAAATVKSDQRGVEVLGGAL
jgi:hypothetical protein